MGFWDSLGRYVDSARISLRTCVENDIDHLILSVCNQKSMCDSIAGIFKSLFKSLKVTVLFWSIKHIRDF